MTYRNSTELFNDDEAGPVAVNKWDVLKMKLGAPVA
jgi:hypothetical protein